MLAMWIDYNAPLIEHWMLTDEPEPYWSEELYEEAESAGETAAFHHSVDGLIGDASEFPSAEVTRTPPVKKDPEIIREMLDGLTAVEEKHRAELAILAAEEREKRIGAIRFAHKLERLQTLARAKRYEEQRLAQIEAENACAGLTP